ncbi:MAG: hypothetical protein VX007_08880, partial [Pseudomonadota bacterium]|nr:hypothetical protein [Pseudomonadota bacterium]
RGGAEIGFGKDFDYVTSLNKQVLELARVVALVQNAVTRSTEWSSAADRRTRRGSRRAAMRPEHARCK